MRRLLFLELNEADAGLLKSLAPGLPALSRLMALNHTHTTTAQTEEHVGLDPWVQWVGIHTGVPASEHGIGHLGEAGRLRHEAFWETVGQEGVRSVVWGPMNARRGRSAACRVFVPDPWNGDEAAHPPALEPLLALPRYYAANYLQWSRRVLVGEGVRTGLGWARRLPRRLLPRLPGLATYVARHRGASPALFTAHDVATAHLFAETCRQERPRLGVLFLNAVAHLQHHVWTRRSVEQGPIRDALHQLDGAIADVLDAWEDADWMVVTGFGQTCREGQPTKVLHRPRNHAAFLAACGLQAQQVRPLMTHDGHAWFADEARRDEALEQLRSAHIDGEPLFDARPTPDDPCRLFYQLLRWTLVPSGACIQLADRTVDFHEHVEVIDVRTGDHTPKGSVWSTLELPPMLDNHRLAHVVCEHFSVRGARGS